MQQTHGMGNEGPPIIFAMMSTLDSGFCGDCFLLNECSSFERLMLQT